MTKLILLLLLPLSYLECIPEAATRGPLRKKVFLEISQNSQENTCARVFFKIRPQACNFTKKETPAQVFSCGFCEISKNTFFTEQLWATASVIIVIDWIILSS